ncbi:MAG: ABC transporter ATP-binding protein [Candidatus Marsarchaeota archaeon]|nr:ABC transporter ATP-binding protein [Candidatus Marsarchaeota archaeon]
MSVQKLNKIFKLAGITKEYVKPSSIQALKGIDLEVSEGEFVSIIGPSGSGKSTFLHLLGCLDKPSKGEIYIDGIKTSDLGDNELSIIRRDKIGFVFQAFNLAATLNVFQNVELPLLISEVGAGERRERVEILLKHVNLFDKKDHFPSQLSGGEKQRVAIARALANNPPVLLADEPTGNLDSKNSKDIMDLIRGLWLNQGLTVVLITHEPVVAAYGTRMIYLRDGKVEKEVKNKPRTASIDGIKEKKGG